MAANRINLTPEDMAELGSAPLGSPTRLRPDPRPGKRFDGFVGVLAQWRTMATFERVTAADVELMQGLAQRVTALRPDLVGAESDVRGAGLESGAGAGGRRPDLAAATVVLATGTWWRGPGPFFRTR